MEKILAMIITRMECVSSLQDKTQTKLRRNHSLRYKLTDLGFFYPLEIHVLLRADVFWDIISSNKIKIQATTANPSDSKLGWDIEETLSNNERILSKLERYREGHFIDNKKCLENGRVSVKFPLNEAQRTALGNIKKIYRQIMVNESQQPTQLMLWRDDDSQALTTLQLNTLTYETALDPFLSTIPCLLQLSKECSDHKIATVNEHDFNADDLNASSNSKEEL
ncbi:hypothetical protein EVAR_58962_1 [Eumeta japonica]|uniref:Uncharacterized protein n=1 Tax=Eumeta variegata TaxID=151549 RepID=A0A4C1YF10_EUMVA|nr:hypothetical protein EVAR_58962_1 [Eumeta japonica]